MSHLTRADMPKKPFDNLPIRKICDNKQFANVNKVAPKTREGNFNLAPY